MKFGYRDVCLEHDTGSRHPETADRLRAIRRGLVKRHGVEYHEGRLADRDSIELVHDTDYLDAIDEFCQRGGGTWDADTIAVEATWDAARAAAGLATWAVDEAIAGADGRETPFAIGRPPGHHAESDDAMGFCFVNNAAVAVQQAIERDAIQTAAIFDWDVHHGNGTQEIFYHAENVLYASVHERGLFPGTGEVSETGDGAGQNTTVNIPLPGGSGDVAYTAVVDQVLDPIIERFDPDLVVVSAGFDAHRHDPISRMRVTTEGYGFLTARLREMVARQDAALAFVLEGGYGLDALAESVGMVHEVFDGHDPTRPTGDVAGGVVDILDEVCGVHDV